MQFHIILWSCSFVDRTNKMSSENQSSLPSPPTFAQMMEDLEIMSSHEKIFRLSQSENIGREQRVGFRLILIELNF